MTRLSDSTTSADTAAEIRDVTKRYGATRALKGVSLSIGRGSVHSLVGENGAGKSTLLGVLAGRVKPESGEVTIFGGTAKTGSPRAARDSGVTAIYQELTIVPAMDAVSNVFLGRPYSRAKWQARTPMVDRFAELSADLGVTISPASRAGSLSIADQQMIEIMRAVQSRARMILFDEPTASLATAERTKLHRLIRTIKSRGVTVVLVSHNMEEVLDLSDQITVFRDGKLIQTRAAAEWSKSQLVQAMIGDKAETLVAALDERARSRRAAPTSPAEHASHASGPTAGPILSVRNLGGHGPVKAIDFDLRPGEVLGIAGLVGSGRSSVLRMLAGMAHSPAGSIQFQGAPRVRVPRSVREARGHGIAIVPEDRKMLGLVPGMSATENIALSDLNRTAALGWVVPSRMRSEAVRSAEAFAFDTARMSAPVRNLSGGNQQKALLARWLFNRPIVLLADEPTRGIDIGAREQIMQALRQYARAGTPVVMVSSETEELLAYCDRILVIARGSLVAEFDPTREPLTEDDVLQAAFAIPEEKHV